MGSGADTNGCGLCRPLSLKEVEFWDERGGFLLDLPTTPWVDPQFTESYQRLGFVFFRWIIIVIALFHKAANQWPRVNGVKHSGFRVASTLYTAVLLQLQCWTFIQFPYCRYSADDCNIIALYRLRCRHLLLQERGGNSWEMGEVSLEAKAGIFDQIQFNRNSHTMKRILKGTMQNTKRSFSANYYS